MTNESGEWTEEAQRLLEHLRESEAVGGRVRKSLQKKEWLEGQERYKRFSGKYSDGVEGGRAAWLDLMERAVGGDEEAKREAAEGRGAMLRQALESELQANVAIGAGCPGTVLMQYDSVTSVSTLLDWMTETAPPTGGPPGVLATIQRQCPVAKTEALEVLSSMVRGGRLHQCQDRDLFQVLVTANGKGEGWRALAPPSPRAAAGAGWGEEALEGAAAALDAEMVEAAASLASSEVVAE